MTTTTTPTCTFRSDVMPAGMVNSTVPGMSFYRHQPTLFASWAFSDGVEVTVRESTETTTYSRYRNASISRITRTKARVYVDAHAEGFNVLEDLTNRTRRPHDAWKPGVAEALARVGITFDKLRWSQRAGCSMCPCSPGFILEGGNVAGNVDVWVKLPGAPTVDETKPARAIA